MYEPPFTRTAARSLEVTNHSCEDCKSCSGASKGQIDHYRLGRLRARIGQLLNMDFHTAQQLEFKTLMERHAEAGFPAIGDLS